MLCPTVNVENKDWKKRKEPCGMWFRKVLSIYQINLTLFRKFINKLPIIIDKYDIPRLKL